MSKNTNNPDVSLNITELRKTQIKEKNFLENIIALMPGHVYWLDKNGTYLGCNNNQAKSAGLISRKEIIGKKNKDLPWNYNTPLLPETLDQVNIEVMQTDKPKIIEEEANLPDGSKGIFLSSKVPLKNENYETIGLLGISIDITERKKLEAKLKRAKKQTEHLSKAKTQFLLNMSHDVKTPLCGIGLSAKLLTELSDDIAVKKIAEQILDSARSLQHFFDNCMALSRLENADVTLVTEQFNFEEMAEQIITMFKPAASSKNIALNLYYHSQVPVIFVGSKHTIYRILQNLIGNAIKFTNKGHVNVRIEPKQALSSHDITIKIIIEDTGIGIPKNQQQAIFERLTRLTSSSNNVYEGSGIGLYIVEKFVKAIQGQIYVESKEGEGSQFTVILPLQIPLC